MDQHLSSSQEPNVINFHEANREALNDKLEEMETKVRELENTILEHASNLHCLLIENLDQILWREEEEGLIEFEPFPNDQGLLKTAKIEKGERWLLGGDTSSNLNYTSEQIEFLNETIEKLHLPR